MLHMQYSCPEHEWSIEFETCSFYLNITPMLYLFIIFFCALAGEAVPVEEPKFNPFTGSGRRLDGKPLKYQPPPVSSSSGARENQPAASAGGGQTSTGPAAQSSSRQSQGKLVFGSNASRSADPQKQKVLGISFIRTV